MIFLQSEKIGIGAELIGFRESRLPNYGYCAPGFSWEERKHCLEEQSPPEHRGGAPI